MDSSAMSGAQQSRQRRWQTERIAQGRCGVCGKRRLGHYAWACDRCALAHRRRRRRRTGGKAWTQGGRGRPPKIAEQRSV
jgi:hypothetical protein